MHLIYQRFAQNACAGSVIADTDPFFKKARGLGATGLQTPADIPHLGDIETMVLLSK